MGRLGMPVGYATILRHVKRSARSQIDPAAIRVAGVDDWAWRKGTTYGTIIVDLERRLPDRSAVSTAKWLKAHPEIEIVSRDRAGLYAEGAREGRHRRGKSLIAFICCRIFGKPSSGSSASSARGSGERPLGKRVGKAPSLL